MLVDTTHTQATAGIVPPSSERPTRQHRKHLSLSVAFMLPAFLVILVFMLGPALWSIYVSFTDMSLTGTGANSINWVGWQNFAHIFRDGEFLNSFRVSLTYLVFSALIGQAGLGLLLALLLQHRNTVFKSVVGAIVIAAWVIPDVVAGFVWSSFLAGGPQSVLAPGLLNNIMMAFGLPQRAWLQDYPMMMIIIANIWRGTAFSMLIYQSALEGVAKELLESANIDGAGAWSRLRYIILPLIKGAVANDLLLITLATLSDFTLVYVLTGGSNMNTELMTIYQYRQAFQFYQIGYGSAVALLIIVVGAILALIYTHLLRIDLK